MKEESNRNLREKIEAHPFELPADSWQQMADILDGKKPVPQPKPVRDDRRRGLLWILLSGLLLTAVYLSAHELWREGVQAFPIPFETPAVAKSLPGEAVSGREASSADKASDDKVTATANSTNSTTAAQGSAARTPRPAAGQMASGRAATNTGGGSSLLPPAEADAGQAAPVPSQALMPAQTVPTQTDTEAVADNTVKLPGAVLPPVPGAEREMLLLEALPTAAPALLSQARPQPEVETVTARRPSPWSFGIKAGADIQTQQTTGLIGGFVAYRIAPRWSIQLEPQFKLRSDNIGQGLELLSMRADTIYAPAFAMAEQSAERITRIHFLELPLTAHYRLNSRWQLLAGVQLVHIRNFSRQDVQKVRSEVSQADLTANSFSVSRPSASLRKWDVGLLAGAEYRLTPALSLDLRYVQGLYELTRSTYFTREADYFNSSVQLSVKWRCCN